MFKALRLSLCLLALPWVGVACNSTSQPSSSTPAVSTRVAWRDYRVDQLLEIVNEAHTGRLEQYSQSRGDANRKVQSNEIVGALVEHMRGGDFGPRWQSGPAPLKGDGSVSWSLEIEQPSGVQCLIETSALSIEEKRARRQLRQAFLDTYNLTYSLQAVEVKDGDTPFAAPAPPAKR